MYLARVPAESGPKEELLSALVLFVKRTCSLVGVSHHPVLRIAGSARIPFMPVVI